jgi:hypothetical protein
MKSKVLALLFVLGSLSLKAQTETLIGDGNRFGGFGGPLFQMAQVDNELAFYSGGGGGMIVNGKFFIGGFGMSLQTDHVVDVDVLGFDVPHYTDFGFGGLWLGYIHKPNKLLHLNFSLPFGGGGIEFDRIAEGADADIDDAVFVINPSVGVELNIVSWMKLNANLGYMVVAGANNPYMGSTALSSPNLQLGLKFGFFAD